MVSPRSIPSRLSNRCLKLGTSLPQLAKRLIALILECHSCILRRSNLLTQPADLHLANVALGSQPVDRFDMLGALALERLLQLHCSRPFPVNVQQRLLLNVGEPLFGRACALALYDGTPVATPSLSAVRPSSKLPDLS